MDQQPATNDAKSPSSSGTTHLWWGYMILAALLLAAVASGKWKPLGWFAAAFGIALGLLAMFLPNLLRSDLAVGRDRWPLLLAGVSVALSLWLSAQWYLPPESQQIDPRALAVLKAFPQTEEAPLPPPKPRSRWSRYLTIRYGVTDPLRQAGWVALEVGIAVMTCLATVKIARRYWPGLAAEPLR